MFDAERLTMTVAPASAALHDGGIGTQRSSQISTKKVKAGSFADLNRSSSPKGILFWPNGPTADWGPPVAGQTAFARTNRGYWARRVSVKRPGIFPLAVTRRH